MTFGVPPPGGPICLTIREQDVAWQTFIVLRKPI